MHSTDRVFGLDLLRALAILFVVCGHASHLLPSVAEHPLFPYFIFDGVTLFFVLSGFLIGRILLRNLSREAVTYRTLLVFWIRRWFRTLPNYFLVLILLISLTAAIGDNTPPLPDSIALYFVFAQNLAWNHPAYFGEAWSLAVEEWFYLCIPIPLFLASKANGAHRHRLILACIALVILASTAIRLLRVADLPPTTEMEWAYTLKMQVVTRMDSLMLGVLGAYLSIHARQAWDKAGTVALIVGLVVLVADQLMRRGTAPQAYLNYWALSVTPLATLLLLPKLSAWQRKPSLISNSITFVSLISYSMYLVNQAPILETLLPWLMPKLMHYLWRFADYSVEIRFTLFWVLTVAVSYLLYRYFELPMMGLRDRWPNASKATELRAFATSNRTS